MDNAENREIIGLMREGRFIDAAEVFAEGERTLPDNIFIELYNHLPTTYRDQLRAYNPREELVTDSLCAGAINYVDIGISLGYTIPQYIINNIEQDYEYERRNKTRGDIAKVLMWEIPYKYLVSKGLIDTSSSDEMRQNKARRTDIHMMD